MEGTPAPGYEVVRVSVTPATILIEGPQSEVASTEMATTGLIPLHGDESGTRRVSVNPVPRAPADSRVRVLNPVPAQVTIEIREKPARRTFDAVPVRATGGGDGRRVQFAPAPSESQSGSFETLSNASAQEFEALITRSCSFRGKDLISDFDGSTSFRAILA